jgi:general secretion pathway protein F
MPLDQALFAVAEQADDARAAKLFTAARTQVAAGETLAGAFARWPRTFSELYRALVAVGAETGRLHDVLARLVDYLEAREALKQRFMLALIYPMLVTVIALAVVAVLLVYVVPQVVSVYQQSRQTLPWLTQALTRPRFSCDRMVLVGGHHRRHGRLCDRGSP